MKLILDEGMPVRTADRLRQAGVDAKHVLEVGLGGASDQAILDRARADGAAVATLDADFHQILAATGADRPSVIRVRIEGLGAETLARLLLDVLQRSGEDIRAGAVVSVGIKRVRLKKPPIRR